jgi:hypothetical protein
MATVVYSLSCSIYKWLQMAVARFRYELPSDNLLLEEGTSWQNACETATSGGLFLQGRKAALPQDWVRTVQ